MQTTTKPTLGISGSSPHINISSNEGSLALTLNDNHYKSNSFAQWDYNRRLEKHKKMIKMLKGTNLDYSLILWPIKSYKHPDKRNYKK